VADIPGFSRLTLCIGKIINSNTHFKKVWLVTSISAKSRN
jgi:hypothetical protein